MRGERGRDRERGGDRERERERENEIGSSVWSPGFETRSNLIQ